MQKIKIGHRAKFRDRDEFFPQVLFPVRAILRRIFTSGVLQALLFDRNLIHSADVCFLFMACVGYSRAQLKTLSSLLKDWPFHPLFACDLISKRQRLLFRMNHRVLILIISKGLGHTILACSWMHHNDLFKPQLPEEKLLVAQ